jgi:heme/copper-type cytochrome/quinol oxidase subunit 4
MLSHNNKTIKQQAYCITILVLAIVHLLLSLLVAFTYSKKDSVVFGFALVSSAVNLVLVILVAIILHNLPKPMEKI